jgi:hypothetical protein
MSEAGQARKAGKDAPFPYTLNPPDYIKFETIYQGAEGPKTAVHAIIQSQKQLDGTLPNAAQLGIKPGTINFDREQLIIVGLGARPTTGYKVAIDNVMYLTDRNAGPTANQNLPDLTLVTYTELKAGGASGDMITYPVHIIKTQKLTGAVQFNEVQPPAAA